MSNAIKVIEPPESGGEGMTGTNTHGLKVLLVGMLCLVASFAQAGVSWKPERQMNGVAGDSRLEQPLELTVDLVNHRYFVADGRNGVLMSFDAEGNRLAAFNAGGQIKKPVDLVLVDQNRIWVADRELNQLLYIDISEKRVQAFSPQRPNGLPVFVDRIGLDSKGRLLVLDRLSGNILLLDDNVSIVREFSGGKAFKGFCDFKTKSDGLWALDGLGRTVYQFGSDGRLLKTIPLSGPLLFPVALEIDKTGQIYILDRHAAEVSTFDPQGQFKYAFLSKGKRDGQLWYPAAMEFDWAQRLCVVDEGNARIQIYSGQ